jgi:hypothetical protein
LCLALEPELLHGALEAPQGATLIAVQWLSSCLTKASEDHPPRWGSRSISRAAGLQVSQLDGDSEQSSSQLDERWEEASFPLPLGVISQERKSMP